MKFPQLADHQHLLLLSRIWYSCIVAQQLSQDFSIFSNSPIKEAQQTFENLLLVAANSRILSTPLSSSRTSLINTTTLHLSVHHFEIACHVMLGITMPSNLKVNKEWLILSVKARSAICSTKPITTAAMAN
jgi:hypothetical protein